MPQIPPFLFSKTYLAQKYSIVEDKEWIFLGSAHPKKGGMEVAKALIENNNNFNDWNFVLIQSGRSTYCPGINVRWIDDLDYPDFLRSCGLVIANSRFLEGWCRVVHEAAILGTPVIGSGSGGMGELLLLVSKTEHFSLEDIIGAVLNPAARVVPKLTALEYLQRKSRAEMARWIKNVKI